MTCICIYDLLFQRVVNFYINIFFIMIKLCLNMRLSIEKSDHKNIFIYMPIMCLNLGYDILLYLLLAVATGEICGWANRKKGLGQTSKAYNKTLLIL